MNENSFTPYGLNYQGLHQKLIEYGKLLDESYDPVNAAIFCMIAMHLHDDWLRKADDNVGEKIRKEISDRDAKKGTFEINVFLQVLRDVANSSKHYILDQENQYRQVTEVHDGTVRDFYEFFYRESTPGFVTKDNYYFSIKTIKEISLDYFSWALSDEVEHPPELINKIRLHAHMWK